MTVPSVPDPTTPSDEQIEAECDDCGAEFSVTPGMSVCLSCHCAIPRLMRGECQRCYEARIARKRSEAGR